MDGGVMSEAEEREARRQQERKEWDELIRRGIRHPQPVPTHLLTAEELKVRQEEWAEQTRKQNVDRVRAVLPKRLQNATIENPLPAGNLYIHGRPGAGKTWAVAATLLANAADNPQTVLWANTPALLAEIKATFDKDADSFPTFYDLLENVDVLVLDDIGAERPTSWATETLFLLVNTAYESMIRTIVTSNHNRETLAQMLGERLVSRLLEDARVVHFTGPDRRLDSLKEPVMRRE